MTDFDEALHQHAFEMVHWRHRTQRCFIEAWGRREEELQEGMEGASGLDRCAVEGFRELGRKRVTSRVKDVEGWPGFTMLKITFALIMITCLL